MYKELLELQRILDNDIAKAHKLENKNVLRERTLALAVEFAEFANELSSFKYWKKNKKINEHDLYEEFADVLHFFFSLYLIVEDDPKADVESVKAMDHNGDEIVKFSLDFYGAVSKIYDEKHKKNINVDALNESYSILLSIALQANMNIDKIKEFYIMKNKINHERIANNY